MFNAAKYIAFSAMILTSSNAWALGTCVSNLTVNTVSTWTRGGSINNGDGNDYYSVQLSNGKTYDAAGGCDSNDACGQANLSLLLSAFSAGYKVTLFGSADGCTEFYGVAINH